MHINGNHLFLPYSFFFVHFVMVSFKENLVEDVFETLDIATRHIHICCLLESAPIGGASQALMNFDYFRAFYLQLQASFLSTEYQCNFV